MCLKINTFFFDRYKKIVVFPGLWKSNKYLLKPSSTIIYCIAITLINQLFEIRSYNIYLVCLMGLMGTKSIEQNFLYIQLT